MCYLQINYATARIMTKKLALQDMSVAGKIRHFLLLCLLQALLSQDVHFTGSAVALHCCKPHSEISRKMENSTTCKIVTF